MKRESLHYKLAKIGNSNNDLWDVSICEYIRKVFWGGVLALFITVLLCFLVGWVCVGLYEIVGAIFGFSTLAPAAMTLMGVSGGIVVIATYHYVKEKWEYKSRDLLKKDNKSFVSSAYKSYKEKICFKVNFED